MLCTRHTHDTECVSVKVGIVAEQLIRGDVQRSIFGHGERVAKGRIAFVHSIDFDLDIASPCFGAIGSSDL